MNSLISLVEKHENEWKLFQIQKEKSWQRWLEKVERQKNSCIEEYGHVPAEVQDQMQIDEYIWNESWEHGKFASRLRQRQEKERSDLVQRNQNSLIHFFERLKAKFNEREENQRDSGR
jgi:hypothetical protein